MDSKKNWSNWIGSRGVKNIINFEQRNLILIRIPKRCLHYGVKSIVCTATRVDVVTCGFDSHRTEGAIKFIPSTILLVLTAPRTVFSVLSDFKPLEVSLEPEFREIKCLEDQYLLENTNIPVEEISDPSMKRLDDKINAVSIERILTVNGFVGMHWYEKLSSEKKAFVPRKWEARQQRVLLQKAADEALNQVVSRYQKTFLGSAS